MKKTVSIIFLSLLIALAAGCSGCPGKGMYDDSISELREQFLYGENQRFEVTLIGGRRENPFEIDGKCGETCDYSLVTVKPKSAVAYSSLKVTIADGDGAEVSGEALKHPYKDEFYFETASRLPDGVTVTLEYGDGHAEIPLSSVRKEGETAWNAALDIALDTLEEALKTYSVNGKFSGEIYVRYIKNPLADDGKYYWYVAFVPAAKPDLSLAALLDAATGEVMATRK